MCSSNVIVMILVAALLNLDKQVFGPFMLGRPMVVGFIMGFLSGELAAGAWLGLSVELLWLAVMPLGGQLTPNAGLAVSAALIALTGSSFAPAVGVCQTKAGQVVAFLTVPFWAWAFTCIDKISRRLVPPQLAQARADLAEGRDPQFFRRNLYGLWSTLGFSLAALLLAVLLNGSLLNLAARLVSDTVLLTLDSLFTFIPFLGLLGMAVFLETKTVNFYIGGLLASILALSAVR